MLTFKKAKADLAGMAKRTNRLFLLSVGALLIGPGPGFGSEKQANGEATVKQNPSGAWKKWKPAIGSSAKPAKASGLCPVGQRPGGRFRSVSIDAACGSFRIDQKACDENFRRNPEFFQGSCFGEAESGAAQGEIARWAAENGYIYNPLMFGIGKER